MNSAAQMKSVAIQDSTMRFESESNGVNTNRLASMLPGETSYTWLSLPA
jgi:hypothetical protein